MSTQSKTNDDRASRPRPRGVLLLYLGCALAAALWVWLLLPVGERLQPRLVEDRFLEDMPLDQQYFGYVTLETKAQMVERVDDAQVWAIGDSSCLFGFATETFQDATGMRALNLGTFGYLGAPGHRDMLEAMLRRHGDPAAVLFWVHPRTLSESPDARQGREYTEWLERRLANGGPLAMAPPERLNDEIGGSLRAAYLDPASWTRPYLFEMLSPAEVHRRLIANGGWFPAQARSTPDFTQASPLHAKQVEGLAAIGRLCEERGIPLFVVGMPWVIGSSVPFEEHQANIDRIVAEMPSAVRVDTVPPRCSWERMQSSTHYAAPEAGRITRLVGAFLLDRLGTPAEGAAVNPR